MYLFFLNLQSCVFGNMRCSVYGCHSDNQAKKNPCRDIKFYHFPKDETMAKKWLYATGRKDPVNLKNACICSKHFLESDFKLNLKHQLLNYTPKNFRGLKEDAVPVANLPFSRKEPLQTDTKSSTKKRLQKRMVTELLNKNCTMSNRLCSVKDCEDRQSKRHQFPDAKVDPILFKKWVDACGNKELVTLDPAMIRRNKKVCHKHFTGDFLMANGRISRIAYPTIFLPHSEKQDDRLVMGSPESSSNSPQYKIEVLDFSERPQVLLQDEHFMESLEALSTSPRYKVDVVKEEIAEDFSADDSIMTSQPTSPQCKIEIVEEDIIETEEGFSKQPTTINIIPENKELLKESIQPKEPTPDILNKRKRHSNSSKKKKCKLLMPNILPIQIKILDSSDNDKEKSLSAWEFVDWLSYVTESINKTMQFENCGLLNTQIFHIPETFYKCLKSKIPAIYLANPVNGMVNGEFFHIMNILHVKEIFDTPKVKLRLSKKFIHSDTIGFVEDEKNESIPENFQTSFIFFLNVGQSTIDESDNTNNSFFIEWIPDITECTRVGQLKLQYKYGRKSTCILTTE